MDMDEWNLNKQHLFNVDALKYYLSRDLLDYWFEINQLEKTDRNGSLIDQFNKLAVVPKYLFIFFHKA